MLTISLPRGADGDVVASIGSGGAFVVGAEVEARYRGKSKFYPGKIAKDNGDGTFAVDYDDGEKEAKVAENLIKAAVALSRVKYHWTTAPATTSCPSAKMNSDVQNQAKHR